MGQWANEKVACLHSDEYGNRKRQERGGGEGEGEEEGEGGGE